MGLKTLQKSLTLTVNFILMNGAEYRDRQGNILEG